MSIYLTAIIKSKPGSVDEVRAILLAMVTNSRSEEACIQYDLHEVTGEPIFVFQEEWKDQAGLDRHNEQPYILAFVAQVPALTDEVVIYKTKKLA